MSSRRMLRAITRWAEVKDGTECFAMVERFHLISTMVRHEELSDQVNSPSESSYASLRKKQSTKLFHYILRPLAFIIYVVFVYSPPKHCSSPSLPLHTSLKSKFIALPKESLELLLNLFGDALMCVLERLRRHSAFAENINYIFPVGPEVSKMLRSAVHVWDFRLLRHAKWADASASAFSVLLCGFFGEGGPGESVFCNKIYGEV